MKTVWQGLAARLLSDRLLLLLLLLVAPLTLWLAVPMMALPGLVHWPTLAALAGLMVLSRGLEDSACLDRAGCWLLARVRGERRLAACLVLFSTLLAAVVTNDVALFIVVPLTLALRRVADLPLGRLVIFEALAVNAGSALSPIGNPQNLLLWQEAGVSFLDFALALLPLGLALLLVVLALVPLAFPSRRLALADVAGQAPPLRRPLMWVSLAAYPVFLLLLESGAVIPALFAVLLLYAVYWRRVLLGVDWGLLLVFALMFVNLGLLAQLPWLQQQAVVLERGEEAVFLAGVLVSQLISNVPAAIFLGNFSDDWRALAWGVNVGGFGFALGSMANLIALRLARGHGLFRAFHFWSVPALLLSMLLGWLLLGWA